MFSAEKGDVRGRDGPPQKVTMDGDGGRERESQNGKGKFTKIRK